MQQPREPLPNEDDSYLEDYLKLDLDSGNMAHYRAVFPRASELKGIIPPRSIRGFSRDYREVIAKCREFQTLSHTEQGLVKTDHTKSTNMQKKVFKDNIKFLNAKTSKIAAVEEHLNGKNIASKR